jgi:hypothetical protein
MRKRETPVDEEILYSRDGKIAGKAGSTWGYTRFQTEGQAYKYSLWRSLEPV